MTRENLNGVRVIRAFCREEQSVADFEKSNDELTCLNEFVGKISALLNPLTYVLINIAAVVLIWQAGLQVNIGSMQQGQVVALYNYMLQIIVELIKLASLIITLNKSVACAERVSGVLAVPTTMNYPAKGGSAKKVTGDAAVTFKMSASPMQEPAQRAYRISALPQNAARPSESSAVPEAENRRWSA